MKTPLLFLLSFLLLTSCSVDDDGIDCALYDPMFPTLFVKFVNESGENLIENGTLDPEQISIETDFLHGSFIFHPENDFANPDAELRVFDNTMELYIPRETNFHYTISFEETEIASLDFTAKETAIACGISYFIPIKAESEGNILEIQEFSGLRFLVEVVWED